MRFFACSAITLAVFSAQNVPLSFLQGSLPHFLQDFNHRSPWSLNLSGSSPPTVHTHLSCLIFSPQQLQRCSNYLSVVSLSPPEGKGHEGRDFWVLSTWQPQCLPPCLAHSRCLIHLWNKEGVLWVTVWLAQGPPVALSPLGH